MKLIGSMLLVLVGVVLFNLTVEAVGFWESVATWTFAIVVAATIFVGILFVLT